ncbi:hypothetical protein SAMN05660330_03321 [Desulforhopalus singaporensis]|uniref:AB hydrolase-1 domain-containing protein n=2 Tax=Desulforhopalus singaporensis TaxID=91360 RepID=A0A1H0TZH3_9BACT|nr:hypothetical protein SAMN05660330_03321 [Desulforhopalus singaporensis]
MTAPYNPPLLLRNCNLQTTLASFTPRKILACLSSRELVKASKEVILECKNGVRLLGSYSHNPENSRGTVTLIHGWEGSMESAYILSAGTHLFNKGFNIFRLNLRDHGPSHHLNRELFNSTRLDEVVCAIVQIQKQFPSDHHFLTGFSLGGNFALRIAGKAPVPGLSLTRTAAICPLINPAAATENIEKNHAIYHYYFVRKWKKSLTRKLAFFPELNYRKSLLQLTRLSLMHDYFVPRHTGYATRQEYFGAYRITGSLLGNLTHPVQIIAAADDPITTADELDHLADLPNLTLEITPFGGHCGFLQDYRLSSWIDGRLEQIFTLR